MVSVPSEVRMDKWLWAVRLFKTRSLAIAACNNGRVCIQDQPVKPSRSTRPGDVITISMEGLVRTVRVLQPIERRVAARLVPESMEDLTPAAEYQKAQEIRSAGAGFTPRAPGEGRPTKRDRRALDRLELEGAL